MSEINKFTILPTSSIARRQSVIFTLDEAIADAKSQEWNWVIVVAGHAEGRARRWSSGVPVTEVVGSLEAVKFEILYATALENMKD